MCSLSFRHGITTETATGGLRCMTSLGAHGADLATAASLQLSWQDTSTNESGFRLERLIGATYTQIATVGANVLSYTDSGLTAGSTYCYQIRAFNSAGTSSPSNLSCATAPETGSTPSTPIVTAPAPNPNTQLGSKWSDYRVSLQIRSTDNDTIGVMFRYQDNDNYYRFAWDAQGKYRRLEKREAGVFEVLAMDAAGYKIGRRYTLEIIAQGASLKVLINGVQIFAVTDPTFSEGTIALYSRCFGMTLTMPTLPAGPLSMRVISMDPRLGQSSMGH